MKKIYETPSIRAILASDEDILTASQFTEAEKNSGQGDLDGANGGGVIYW